MPENRSRPEHEADPVKSSSVGKLGAALGTAGTTGGAILAFLAAKSSESVFILVAVTMFVALVVSGVLLQLSTKTIAVEGIEAQTYRRFPKWTSWTAWS